MAMTPETIARYGDELYDSLISCVPIELDRHAANQRVIQLIAVARDGFWCHCHVYFSALKV